MIFRQKLQVVTLLFLSLLAFASYHQGTGSVAWLQYLTLIAIMFFMFIFDMAFTNDSMFIFDPDADNWRRKVVRTSVNL
jgi:steroid 5-alpha reductase family enzyme